MPAPAMGSDTSRKSLWGPVLVSGYGAAALMWCLWFVTHMPAVAMPSSRSGPIILGGMLAAFIVLGVTLRGAAYPTRLAALAGLLGGILGSVLNLLLLGSKLVEQPVQEALAGGAPTAADAAGLRPGTAVIVFGWLALGALLGVAGVMAGGAMVRPRNGSPDWLARMALVTCGAFLPLLLIGGLVTSTRSGMAVPDWPGSYGANMFLYPLSLMSHPRIFMEHSHRLFGALVGLTSLAMMLMTLMGKGVSRQSKILAVVLFVMVCVQGVLGGLRVTENKPVLAMLHGILAQVTFAMAAWLAASLIRAVRDAAVQPGLTKLVRVCGTGLVHAYILQLAFGAAYRHLGQPHALYSHIGFSFIVLAVGVMGGAMALRGSRATGAGHLLRRTGVAVMILITLQFVLGWGALAMIGQIGEKPVSPMPEEIATAQVVQPIRALVRTLHQANGALLLGAATLLSVLGQRMVARKK